MNCDTHVSGRETRHHTAGVMPDSDPASRILSIEFRGLF